MHPSSLSSSLSILISMIIVSQNQIKAEAKAESSQSNTNKQTAASNKQTNKQTDKRSTDSKHNKRLVNNSTARSRPTSDTADQIATIMTTKPATNASSITKYHDTRLQADQRQFGGMLLVFSAAAITFPLANIATLVGPDGTTADEGIPLTSLIASIFVVTIGIVGMITGYLSLLHDFNHKYLSGALIVLSQLAWVPFITDMTAVGRAARTGEAFIPAAYDASASDVRFVGAMGILGILSYGTAFLGSLSFVAFAMHSYNVGKYEQRAGSYYRGRFAFYIIVLFIAGISQLLLGSYLIAAIGNGPLSEGAVAVAMYFVNFPEISVFVGLVQILNASFGMARYFGIAGGSDATSHSFQATSLFQWIAMLSLQIVTQVAYSPGGTAAARAPSTAMMTLAMSLLPAYLDHKMRSVPDVLPPHYYKSSLSSQDKAGSSSSDSDDNEETAAGRV